MVGQFSIRILDYMRIKILLLFVILAFAYTLGSNAQFYYRIQANFSIKEKTNNYERLTMGTVFFDKHNRKLVYNITFPEPEIWVIQDTLMVRLVNDTIAGSTPAHGMIDFSVFSLSLSGNLNYFGLDKSPYVLSNTEAQGGMVITTWQPPTEFAERMGQIKMAQKSKRLNGIIMYNTEGQILSKQFYKQYADISGIDFPTEIVQFSYLPYAQTTQITTFRNVTLNSNQNETYYNYQFN